MSYTKNEWHDLLPTYSTDVQYRVGNTVNHNNKVYVCIRDTSGPFVASNWNEMVDANAVKGTPITSEKLNRIENALSEAIDHKNEKGNMHEVSSSNLALGNIPIYADTTDYAIGTESSFPVVLGKIKLAIKKLKEHISAVNPHSGSAPTSHSHTISDLTTGILPVSKGGTGSSNLDSVTVGAAKKIIGAGKITTNLQGTSGASYDGTSDVSVGVSGILPVAKGGTGTSNLDNVTAGAAKKLATARTMRTNLASTSTASFDGSGNVTPGVTGILGTSHGGTGKSTLTEFFDTYGLNYFRINPDITGFYGEANDMLVIKLKNGLQIVAGREVMTAAAESIETTEVVFGSNFSVVPFVAVTPETSTLTKTAAVTNVKRDRFTLVLQNKMSKASGATKIHYFAIG